MLSWDFSTLEKEENTWPRNVSIQFTTNTASYGTDWHTFIFQMKLFIIIIIYVTANGLSRGGSGYYACT